MLAVSLLLARLVRGGASHLPPRGPRSAMALLPHQQLVSSVALPPLCLATRLHPPVGL